MNGDAAMAFGAWWQSLITEGYHLVNRLGYYITENPSEPDTEYEIDYYEYQED